jgi:hypothetical protein
MKLYEVRKGYVFKLGREMIQPGMQRELTEEQIKGQAWKLEEVKRKPGPKPKENKVMESPVKKVIETSKKVK